MASTTAFTFESSSAWRSCILTSSTMEAPILPETLELISPRTGITTMRSLPEPLRSTRSSSRSDLRSFDWNSPPTVLLLLPTSATFTSKLMHSTITRGTHRQPDLVLLIRERNPARENPPRQAACWEKSPATPGNDAKLEMERR